jgi:ABC-type anion transport system duplicated permease subunit
MPTYMSDVNWTYVVLMAALAFVAALLGSLIAFRNRFAGAIIAAVLFAAGFVAWNYYPHSFGLPIVKSYGTDGTNSGGG